MLRCGRKSGFWNLYIFSSVFQKCKAKTGPRQALTILTVPPYWGNFQYGAVPYCVHVYLLAKFELSKRKKTIVFHSSREYFSKLMFFISNMCKNVKCVGTVCSSPSSHCLLSLCPNFLFSLHSRQIVSANWNITPPSSLSTSRVGFGLPYHSHGTKLQKKLKNILEPPKRNRPGVKRLRCGC